MIERIIIAGFGGQGIMLLGKILAEAAMLENKQVTWMPSYGAEVRGGTAHCMVVISDRQIGSPYVDKADTLIAMNGPSFERFKSRVGKDGVIFANSSLVPVHSFSNSHAKAVGFPFTGIASEMGNIRVANMVALGCFIGKKKIIHIKSVLEAIDRIAPQDKRGLIEINRKALLEGEKLK